MNIPLKAQVRRLLPRSAHSHRILAGPLRGARLFTSWHDYPGAILGKTERPLLAWFNRNVSPDETWIDVGAHYGYTAIALSRSVGPGGRVFAFEPVRATAGCIARTRELNRLHHLHVIPLGLASCSRIETRHLPLVRGMADSTLSASGWNERIRVVSFHSVWDLISAPNPEIHGVKVDVQGMELEVLEGMRGALCRYRPKLVIEFHRGANREAILHLLRSCGYREPGEPIESEVASSPVYADDRSYAFRPTAAAGLTQESPSVGACTF